MGGYGGSGTEGIRWACNGDARKLLKPGEALPGGWVYQKERTVAKPKKSKNLDKGGGPNKGKMYITNGEDNQYIYPGDDIPDGWANNSSANM